MIVIIEGPRGVGKTTLIEELHTELIASTRDSSIDVVKWKAVRGDSPSLDMVTAIYRDFVNGTVFLVDRFHLTEYVMSDALNRYTSSSAQLKKDTLYIESCLYQCRALGIILTASLPILKERVNKREEADRGIDIPWEKVIPGWDTARELSTFGLYKNETEAQKETIIRLLKNQILAEIQLEV